MELMIKMLFLKKWIKDHVSTNAQDLSPYFKKDGSQQMTGNLNMGNKKNINVSDPTSSKDVINKSYLEANTIGLNVNSDWDVRGKKIFNVNQDFTANDVVPDIRYIKSITPLGTRDNNNNFNCQQKVLYNNKINGLDTDINVKWVKDRYIPVTGTSNNLDMNGKKISNIANGTSTNDAVNKSYVDTRLNTKATSTTLAGYLKRDGGNKLTSNLDLSNTYKVINCVEPHQTLMP